MHYVYLLRSESHPDQRYVGLTNDLRSRLQQHNSGKSPHTAKFTPWILHAYFAFEDQRLASEFEQYLKTGSGREFARRHFLVIGSVAGLLRSFRCRRTDLQLRQFGRRERLYVQHQLVPDLPRFAGIREDRIRFRFADIQAGRHAAGHSFPLKSACRLIVNTLRIFGDGNELTGEHLAHQPIEHVTVGQSRCPAIDQNWLHQDQPRQLAAQE